MPKDIEPLMVKRVDASKLLGIGVLKIDTLIKQGKLDARKSDRHVLITMSSIKKYLESLKSVR